MNKLLALVIDGDEAHLQVVAGWLQEGGYDVVSAEDGLSGLRQYFALHPDFVIIDLDVAEMPGWQVVERIREITDTPVLVTAVEADTANLKKGFDLSIDGFLLKPAKKDELLVRMDAIRDRNYGDGSKQRHIYQRNGLTIDWRSCEVYVRGQPVSLTGTEFKLLSYLVERRGWVLSHDQILNHVWGPDYVGDRDQVKLYVWYLRQKIEENGSKPSLIVTKRGLGYTFVG